MNDLAPTQFGLFAKHWTPGKVKTRLAASIGERAAAEVARAFAETLVERFSSTADRRVIGYSPADAEVAFIQLGGAAWRAQQQAAGDLGARIRHYFQQAIGHGPHRVVLIGADSPNLPVDYVAGAFEALNHHRLVLAPTPDGGYCLVGARLDNASGVPPIFDAMPWSEPGLWRATRGRLASEGWLEGREYQILPEWYDVDTLDDLNRLRADLQTPNDPVLAKLRERLNTILTAPLPP